MRYTRLGWRVNLALLRSVLCAGLPACISFCLLCGENRIDIFYGSLEPELLTVLYPLAVMPVDTGMAVYWRECCWRMEERVLLNKNVLKTTSLRQM